MPQDEGDAPDARIPAHIWVAAHLKRLGAEGLSYYVVHTGAYAAGTVMLKLVSPGVACRVVQQQRDAAGKQGWMIVLEGEGRDGESKADALIARAIARDPDLWAIEIEDREMNNPFEGTEF